MKHNTEKAVMGALEQESAILKVFKEFEFKKNPKKVKKLALKVWQDPESTDIQKTLALQIAQAKNSTQAADALVKRVEDCAMIIESFIAAGCHGMIMHDEVVYPVHIKANPKWLSPDDPWDIEDEQLIRCEAANQWMREHNYGYFAGRVTLFPQFGFSGIPEMIILKCTENTESLHRYPGTNFYLREAGLAV